jgi:opacity protein-like surface antigen
MNFFQRILLATVALTSLALPRAFAADYDPPIYIDDAPEYVPVEIGSGWYLRGDIGYAVNDPFRHDAFATGPLYSFREKFNPISGSIGMGYNFSDYFRGEFNIGLLPTRRATLDFLTDDGLGNVASDVAVEADNKLWSGMINAYADLGTFVGITPYVGAGVGVVYNKRSYELSEDFRDPAIVDIAIADTERHYDYAYSLAAGLSYAVTPSLSLDAGYEYFSAPGAEYADITGPRTYSIRRGIDFHQVKVGLRYDLW